jgi:Fe-S cluster assembly protein SufD
MHIINLSDETLSKTFKISSNEDYFLYGIGPGSANLSFEITSENINLNIFGIVILTDSSNIELKTVVKHLKTNSASWFHLKGLFLQDSRMDFEGMIDIGTEAAGSDAYLKNDNLVIGDNAIVNASPQLEIKNQDVKASHGVTIKTLEEVETFYLKSRGLNQKIADELLIKGFVSDIIEKCDDEKIKSVILHSLSLQK